MMKKLVVLVCLVSLMVSMCNAEVMAASSLDFSEIFKNPGSFINVSVATNVTVELDFKKINNTIKNINFPIKDTKYNKYHVRNLQIKKVDMDYIYFSSDIHVRLYTKGLFGKLWKYIDKSGSCEFKIKYEIGSSGTSITFKKINVGDISIDRNIFEYILLPEKEIADLIIKEINISKSINEKIELKFLETIYIKFSKMYTKGDKLYIDFAINFPDLLDDFIRLISGQGIKVTDARKSSTSNFSSSRNFAIRSLNVR